MLPIIRTVVEEASRREMSIPRVHGDCRYVFRGFYFLSPTNTFLGQVWLQDSSQVESQQGCGSRKTSQPGETPQRKQISASFIFFLCVSIFSNYFTYFGAAREGPRNPTDYNDLSSVMTACNSFPLYTLFSMFGGWDIRLLVLYLGPIPVCESRLL